MARGSAPFEAPVRPPRSALIGGCGSAPPLPSAFINAVPTFIHLVPRQPSRPLPARSSQLRRLGRLGRGRFVAPSGRLLGERPRPRRPPRRPQTARIGLTQRRSPTRTPPPCVGGEEPGGGVGWGSESGQRRQQSEELPLARASAARAFEGSAAAGGAKSGPRRVNVRISFNRIFQCFHSHVCTGG